jgi:small-conductance mechanosensitive channel
MQNIAENFVAGLILLGERTLKPGDIIDVEGAVVKVTRLGIRATVVRSRDDEDLIVPNSLLVKATVKNYTLKDSVYRLRTQVGVVYGSDMKQVRSILERVSREIPWRLGEFEPRIFMTEFGNHSVNWDISVWIADPWRALIRRSELNEAIWWSLKDEGIVIAFPQLDVHFDPTVVQSLRGLGPRAA